jgi:hypothetical protein
MIRDISRQEFDVRN